MYKNTIQKSIGDLWTIKYMDVYAGKHYSRFGIYYYQRSLSVWHWVDWLASDNVHVCPYAHIVYMQRGWLL